ncbi:MAG TPA: TIGR00730 family Rossman fold protein [Solirubrobacteraceae bacterium]|jgi:uncharacterized protein (TIGR00730 family)|nr:TIGR00730 family Rossman fold protein [Solirubrobacteraceae bacterium]
MRRVCVYAGASAGADPIFRAAARELGELLARSGIGLVYGGASIGLMGAVADATLASGGEAIGVIPTGLKRKEVAHEALSELHTVGSMHERKAMMSEMADAFVALPGGLGTLDELLEAATWTQLGIHAKPCGLLNVGGYWDSLVAQLDRAGAEGFLRADHRRVLIVEVDPLTLLQRLASWSPPPAIWRASAGEVS